LIFDGIFGLKVKENNLKKWINFLDKDIINNIQREYIEILKNWEKEYKKNSKNNLKKMRPEGSALGVKNSKRKMRCER